MLTDKQFRDILAEHIVDDKAEKALRDDRQELLNKIEHERAKISEREQILEAKVLELEVKQK